MAERQQEGALFPSIFDADSDDESDPDEAYRKLNRDDTGPSLLPLNEAVSEVPRTFQDFQNILLPRIRPDPELHTPSVDEQQSLANVVCGEVANQFFSLQQLATDPFLSAGECNELHRQIVIRVLGLCEELYSAYLARAKEVCRGSGLFSLTAGLSRLRGQLSLHLSKSLNIPLIRRDVLFEMRSRCKSKQLPPVVGPPRSHGGQRRPKSSVGGVGDLGMPTTASLRRRVRKMEAAVRQDLAPLVSASPAPQTRGVPTSCPVDALLQYGQSSTAADGDNRELLHQAPPTSECHAPPALVRAGSQPELHYDFLLADFRMVAKSSVADRRWSHEEKWGVSRCRSVERLRGASEDREEGQDMLVLGECTWEQLNNDLRSLVMQKPMLPKLQHDVADDISPLLLARGHGLSGRKAKELQKHITQSAWSSHVDHTPRAVPLINRIPPTRELSRRPNRPVSVAESSNAHMAPPSAGVDSPLEVALPDDRTRGHTLGVPGMMLDRLLHAGQETMQLTDSFQLSQQGTEPGSFQLDSFTDSASGRCRGSGGLQGSVRGRHGLAELSQYSFSHESSTLADGGFPMEEAGEDLEEGVDAGQQAVHPGEQEVELCEEEINKEKQEVDPLREAHCPPQPDVVHVVLPSRQEALVSDVRVSERSPWMSLRLRGYGSRWDHLLGELTPEEKATLDQGERQAEQVKGVYREIMPTLPQDHLQFDADPMVEPCMDAKVDLGEVLASSTLSHRQSRRIINPSLRQAEDPPWGRGDKEAWLSSHQFSGPTPRDLKEQHGPDALTNPNLAPQLRAYHSWVSWWKSVLSVDDYKRYLKGQESDYLGLVYHLYNSDSDSEEEEIREAAHKEQERRKLELKRRMSKLRQLQEEKQAYHRGEWNVKTISMGGLGCPPLVGEEWVEGAKQERTVDGATEIQGSTQERSYQQRLEAIWNHLEYSEKDRMDMAVKYSAEGLRYKMDKVLSVWEDACRGIDVREECLKDVETFEEVASNPNRFFAKGPGGSAAVRLQEAKQRARLLKELEEASQRVSQCITELQCKYGDVLLYKGGPYVEKMHRDHTEMLYWLQQERRQDVLHVATQQLAVK